MLLWTAGGLHQASEEKINTPESPPSPARPPTPPPYLPGTRKSNRIQTSVVEKMRACSEVFDRNATYDTMATYNWPRLGLVELRQVYEGIIPLNWGVFATTNFSESDVISVYGGAVVDKETEGTTTHDMGIGKTGMVIRGRQIDPNKKYNSDRVGQMCNSGHGRKIANNAAFWPMAVNLVGDEYQKNIPCNVTTGRYHRTILVVVALMDIAAGTEICCDYGSGYDWGTNGIELPSEDLEE
jgi:hypothetical protein